MTGDPKITIIRDGGAMNKLFTSCPIITQPITLDEAIKIFNEEGKVAFLFADSVVGIRDIDLFKGYLKLTKGCFQVFISKKGEHGRKYKVIGYE